MMIVDAEFHRLSDLSITDLFEAVGVYVLWNPGAVARPSYIGEGALLKRLHGHSDDWLRRGGDGYAAILGYTTERSKKFDAEILEGTLLEVAEMLGRWPTGNKQGARTRALWSRSERGVKTVKVSVRGWHPLRWEARLPEPVDFKWRYDEDGWSLDESQIPWRARAGRML